MDDEKLLPVGEESVVISEKEVPAASPAPKAVLPGVPSPAQQSWGAVISIVIIVLMVIIGAFYAWGQRIAQNGMPAASTTQ
jgi:hypothetical protein